MESEKAWGIFPLLLLRVLETERKRKGGPWEESVLLNPTQIDDGWYRSNGVTELRRIGSRLRIIAGLDMEPDLRG
jgi:hypothetical protein